ncbi:hypothetical protein L1887_11695 [Cichorium endivia]|nr:hypothetical protein L1887_11695 [Cichorium endivia]
MIAEDGGGGVLRSKVYQMLCRVFGRKKNKKQKDDEGRESAAELAGDGGGGSLRWSYSECVVLDVRSFKIQNEHMEVLSPQILVRVSRKESGDGSGSEGATVNDGGEDEGGGRSFRPCLNDGGEVEGGGRGFESSGRPWQRVNIER